ncbi:MAG TPA: hypothetical protein VH797_01095, partial [Nitrososphaeraceae archaeon]
MNRQHPVLTFVILTILVLGGLFFIGGNMIPLQASTDTSKTNTATSNATLTTINEQNKLINDLVNTGKLTEEEAKEIITRVMLIDQLVKSGKFTEDEAKEFVTNLMNKESNETNVTNGQNIPEANLTAAVPETPEVPEANLTAAVPETPEVPEANLTA